MGGSGKPDGQRSRWASASFLIPACDLWHIVGMAEIINLRRLKKRRAREDAAAEAAAARSRHGRTLAKREADARGRSAQERKLDDALLDSSAGSGEPRE